MRQTLLIALLALLFSGVFFVNTGSHFIGDGGDNYEYFGFMHLTKNNLALLKHPFAETDILRYPSGFDYSYGFDGVFAVLTGSLLGFLARPILAYNLTLTLIIFTNILFSYYAFIKLGRLFELKKNIKLRALISALIFGAAPFVFARINGHLNLAFIAGFPLFVTYLLILNKKITQNTAEIKQKDINLVALGLLFISFGSLQYLILVLFTLPFLILYLLFVEKTLDKYLVFFKTHYKKIILSLSYFLAVFLFIFWGYLRAIFTGNLIYVEAVEKYFQPHFLDIILPNRYLGDLWALLNPSEISIERVITVGTLELALFIYLIIRTKRRNLRYFGLALFGVYALLSFGVISIPYYPEGGRSAVLVSLFIALFFLIESQRLDNPMLLSLLFAAVIVERLFFNLHVHYPVASNLLENRIPNMPGTATLNVPLSKYNTYRSALPVFYEKKVLDGYFHYTAANARSERLLKDELFSRFICDLERDNEPYYNYADQDRERTFEALRIMDVRSIVLFKDDLVGKFFWEDCANVRDWWYWLNPQTLVLKKDSDDVVKNNFEFVEENPHTIAQIYFEREGRFVLNGMFVTPKTVGDLLIFLPDGRLITPDLSETEQGYEYSFDPPLELDVKAGEVIEIRSDKKMSLNRYLTIFYLFDENKASLVRKPYYLENVYSDTNVEIYQLGF